MTNTRAVQAVGGWLLAGAGRRGLPSVPMASGKENALDKSTIRSHGTTSAWTGDIETVALTVLYHPNLARVGDRAILKDLSSGRSVPLSRTEPVFSHPRQAAGEPLLDEYLSRKPLYFSVLAEGGVRIQLGDTGTKLMVRGQPVTASITFTAEQVRRGVVLELTRRVVLLLHVVTAPEDVLRSVDAPEAARELIGESEGLHRVLGDIRRVADLELPVLLRGETGSGKELVAKAIHEASPRRQQPYVSVNIAAVPASLAAAGLFGSEKGSFTGSVERHVGFFGQASGGTLFLDEIGDAPLELQVALLRVLESGELQIVGAKKISKVDVRIITATDADLEEKLAAGTFRGPLLNRISAYEIWIPPLRERRDDIGRLLVHFLRKELDAIGEAHRLNPPRPNGKPWLPSSLVARFADFDWPGNVRELRNAVRKLVIGNRGRDRATATPAIQRLLKRKVHAAAKPPSAPPAEPAPATKTPTPRARKEPAMEASLTRPPTPRKPADVTEEEFDQALRACRWELEATAQRLGISRASIYMLIKRYPRFRTAGNLTPEEITRSHRKLEGNIARMAEDLEVSERALARRVKELGLK